MNDASPKLLAIVEVDETKSVKCQAPGCKHAVFRKVHVVSVDQKVQVLGSSCFRKLFQGYVVAKSKPCFTANSGRRLTEEEHRLLRENTEELVKKFESEHRALLTRTASTPRQSGRVRTRGALFADPLADVDPSVIAVAKKAVAVRHGCDPDLPGWKGLVIAEVQAILRRNAT